MTFKDLFLSSCESGSHLHPPQPLEHEVKTDPVVAQSDEEHYRRELNTINVGKKGHIMKLSKPVSDFVPSPIS